MKKEVKNFIKMELSLYKLKKAELRNHKINRLADCSYHKMLTHVVSSIKNALAALPDSLRLYAQIRYFRRNTAKSAWIAKKLMVSERTIARWDAQLLGCIAVHMGIVKSWE